MKEFTPQRIKFFPLFRVDTDQERRQKLKKKKKMAFPERYPFSLGKQTDSRHTVLGSRSFAFDIIPLYTGELFHSYMLDESICLFCHFVAFILFLDGKSC